MKTSAKRGFTLIELLVVIAIIALLTGIILTSLVGSKAKGRDAKRASDLAQIQLAIEQYFDRCDQYPSSLSTSANNGCPTNNGVQINLGNYISKLPTDPTSNATYDYAVNNATTPTDYVIHASFEAVNTASPQSAPAPTGFPTGWTIASGVSFTCDTSMNYCVRPN